jgi:hemerythrin-like domain-containing protein
MIKVTELNEQNAKIKELSSVLHYLISSKEMCNTETTCDLFLKYTEEVTDHLYLEEREVYGHLLNHPDVKVKNTINDFFSGSIEIKRVFNEYLGQWCKSKKLRVTKHAAFLKDSEDMFNLVLNRIDAETNILYPMIEKVLDEGVAA